MKENLRKSKADHLLAGLTNKDIKKFDKFIINLLGSSGATILKYWDYRLSQKKLAGTFDSPDGKGNFSRKIISDFVKILEKFYALKGFEKDSLTENSYLISELRDRQLYKLFNFLLDETKKLLKSDVRKGYTNYINHLKLNLEEYFLYNSQNEDLSMYETSVNMSSVSEILLVQSKLFEHINKKLYNDDDGINVDVLINIENVIEFVKRNLQMLQKEHQGVYALYLIYLMIENPDDESKSLDALSYINKNYNHLTVNFLQLSYELIFRFYAIRINSANSKSMNELYNIIKEIEKKNLFYNIQHIQPLNFLMIIKVCLTLEDVEFADMFLFKYNKKINTQYRKPVSTICQAMIDLEKSRYAHARNLLINDKSKNTSIYIFSKATLLKALFELNDLRTVLPLIDTVKHYLTRHMDVKSPYGESIFLFLNHLNALCTAKRKLGRGAERLIGKINNGKGFFQKKWVLAKAEELARLKNKK